MGKQRPITTHFAPPSALRRMRRWTASLSRHGIKASHRDVAPSRQPKQAALAPPANEVGCPCWAFLAK